MKIRDIFNDIEIKLVCLLLSIIMWLYASNPRGTEAIDNFMSILSRDRQGIMTFRKVPIQISGLEKNLVIEPKEIDSLQVKASAAELELGKFQLIIEIEQKDEERGKVKLTSKNVKLPEGLSLVKLEPDEIQIVK